MAAAVVVGGFLVWAGVATPPLPKSADVSTCSAPAGVAPTSIDRSDPWQRLAEACNGGTCFTQDETTGLVWCGSSISFQDVAEAAAPILWFSPDEPLLRASNRGWTGGLPERFPWDTEDASCPDDPAASCVGRAYYLLSRDKAGNEPPAAATHEPYPQRLVDLAGYRGRTFYVTYLFFYSQDYGVNGHPLDLEGAEFRMRVNETRRPGTYRLNVAGVKGLAHGLNWAANRLQVEPAGWLTYKAAAADALFPTTILVEEGKHASCPDRNGDGAYTPGYDVNSFVNDAWGVRDTFGVGVLARRYDSTHTKLRRRQERVFPGADPPCASDVADRPCSPGDPMAQAALAVRRAKYEERVGAARGGPESRAWPDEPPWVYRLRPACGAEGVCTQGGIHAQLHQAEPERKNDSGSHVVDVLHEKVTPWRRASERLPLSYRAERGHGLAFTAPYVLTVPGVSLVWAPKLNATFGRGSEKTFTAGAVMSPSVSRWLDWYFFAGGERFDRGSTHDTSFVSELGFRFRWKPTYFEGKLPLLGLRLGLQTTNLRRPREPRLIVEVGSGFL